MKVKAHRPKPLIQQPAVRPSPVENNGAAGSTETVQVPTDLWAAILKYLTARPFVEVADCLLALRSLGLTGPKGPSRQPEAAAAPAAKD